MDGVRLRGDGVREGKKGDGVRNRKREKGANGNGERVRRLEGDGGGDEDGEVRGDRARLRG